MEMDLGEGNFTLRLYMVLEAFRTPRDGLESWPSLLPRSIRTLLLSGASTKTKTLRKQRSKLQVSEVFGSVSIDL